MSRDCNSLSLKPRNKSVSLALAEMCLRGKRYTDAAGYVQRVLDWDPSCTVSKGLLRSILLGHAMEQTAVNDVYGAVANYKRVLELLPTPSPGGEVSDELAGAEMQRAEISFLLGGLYECVGDMPTAVEWYRCVYCSLLSRPFLV